jgi:hypothetical protein
VRRTAIDDWTASRDDPVVLAAGDRVTVGRRDDTWPQYRWCIAPDGREGWVPDDVLEEKPEGWAAALPYSARELTVRTGEQVEAIRFMADWWWCRNTAGDEGWVPERVLAER